MTLFRSQGLFPALVMSVLLTACTTLPAPVSSGKSSAVKTEENSVPALLDYHQRLQRMSSQELIRERSALASVPPAPPVQLRQAMLFGQARGPSDPAKASALLNNLLKSSTPEAAELHSLARILAAHYQERIKLESQNERLVQQVKDSQRKNDELQEKLNAMAEIELTIPLRPTGSKKPPESP